MKGKGGGKTASSKTGLKGLHTEMLFGRQNYVLLALGVLLIVAGFTIMRIENEVYGFISLYVAPLVILGGYITVIFSVLKRRSLDTDSAGSSDSLGSSGSSGSSGSAMGKTGTMEADI